MGAFFLLGEENILNLGCGSGGDCGYTKDLYLCRTL
jgi:hypothetical protein